MKSFTRFAFTLTLTLLSSKAFALNSDKLIQCYTDSSKKELGLILQVSEKTHHLYVVRPGTWDSARLYPVAAAEGATGSEFCSSFGLYCIKAPATGSAFQITSRFFKFQPRVAYCENADLSQVK